MSSSSSANQSIDLCGTPYSCSRMPRIQWPADTRNDFTPTLRPIRSFGCLMPLRRVDEHEAVAEPPVQEHRDRGDRHALVAGHDVGGARCLGHVEIALADEAPVPRRRIHVGQDGQVDAVRLDLALLEGAHDLVVAAGEGDRDFAGHGRQISRNGPENPGGIGTLGGGCGWAAAGIPSVRSRESGNPVCPDEVQLALGPRLRGDERGLHRHLVEEALDLAAQVGDRALHRLRGAQHGLRRAARRGRGARHLAEHRRPPSRCPARRSSRCAKSRRSRRSAAPRRPRPPRCSR